MHFSHLLSAFWSLSKDNFMNGFVFFRGRIYSNSFFKQTFDMHYWDFFFILCRGLDWAGLVWLMELWVLTNNVVFVRCCFKFLNYFPLYVFKVVLKSIVLWYFVCSWRMVGDMVYPFNAMFFSLAIYKVVFEMSLVVWFNLLRGTMSLKDLFLRLRMVLWAVVWGIGYVFNYFVVVFTMVST